MATNNARTTSGRDDDPVESARMSFGDHLDELRSCLIRALIGFALAAAVALYYGAHVLDVIFRPLLIVQRANGLQPRLQALGPTDVFAAYMKVSILTGLIVSMPWLLYQVWRFVAAGLYPTERRFVRLLTWSSSGLFLVGVLFLYFLVLPIVLQFFVSFNRGFDAASITISPLQRMLIQVPAAQPIPDSAGQIGRLPVLSQNPSQPQDGDAWVNSETRRLCVKTPLGVLSSPLEPGAEAPAVFSEFAIDFYIAFVLQLSIAFGVAFETPLVVCFLAWVGIVSADTMARSRRYVLFAIVVVAAVITPPDVVSQLMLSVPMYLLFEVGVRVARIAERAKDRPVDGAA